MKFINDLTRAQKAIDAGDAAGAERYLRLSESGARRAQVPAQGSYQDELNHQRRRLARLVRA